jgi:hypothetical protein
MCVSFEGQRENTINFKCPLSHSKIAIKMGVMKVVILSFAHYTCMLASNNCEYFCQSEIGSNLKSNFSTTV